MSQPGQAPNQNRVVELKASAHLMTMDAGIFCVFHAAGQPAAAATGFPGVRISPAPGTAPGAVAISTFDAEGWLGASNGAALIRVMRGPAQVMVTIYQDPAVQSDSPRLQVVQLAGAAAAPAAAPVAVGSPAAVKAPAAPPAPGGKAEIAAHIQRRGDVLARIGEWMGVPESQAWIEGFGIAPESGVPVQDIEYQAVLGKGWLSPWAEGGQYCGSRGMALPILGLRVRLKGESAKTHDLRLTATFTDGTRVGPLDGTEAAEAESLAPLEAFLVEIVPAGSAKPVAGAVRAGSSRKGAGKADAAPVKKGGRGAASKAVAAKDETPVVAAEEAPKRRGRPSKAAAEAAPVVAEVTRKGTPVKAKAGKGAPAKAAPKVEKAAAPKRRGAAKR